jgi:hypothetical protein
VVVRGWERRRGGGVDGPRMDGRRQQKHDKQKQQLQ